MGVFDRIKSFISLREDNIRNDKEVSNISPLEVNYKQRMTETDFPDLDEFDFLDYGSFNKFRQLSDDRRVQYDAYDEMTKDIIISSAIQLYTEDATQYDTLGRVIWVESEDGELAKYLNDLIDILEIPKKLQAIYYSLIEYGDVYLRLYKKPKENTTSTDSTEDNKGYGETFGKTSEFQPLLEGLIDISVDYEDYVELVDYPEDVFDLLYKGKTCQYAVTNRNAGVNRQERTELYPPDQFVHICIDNVHIRDREEFEFTTTHKETGKKQLHRYKVRRGKSLLYDIYAVEKEIQLIESSMLLNRLSKAAITRLVSVEIGETPKPEVKKILRRVKSALESKLSIDKASGTLRSYNSPSGIDNIIVNPVRNGKGTISTQTIGGDFDAKSIIDLDYFNNKRFGGLRIPKAFLGWDEAVGSNSGASLTKLDSRYGRTVKALQNCVIYGITDLLNLFLLHRGYGDRINEFTVRVVSPTTVEDTDRDELILNRLNIISQFLSVAEQAQISYTKDLFDYLMVKYIGDPEVNSMIVNHKNDKPESDEDDEVVILLRRHSDDQK